MTRLLEKERARAQNQLRHGHLRVVDEDTPPAAPAIDLPDPTDPRPVARITCTLGALADLVDVLEYQQVPPVTDVAQTAHILAAAALVARHTLAHGGLDAGAQPLAVGQHTERSLAALQPALEATPAPPFAGLPAVTAVDPGDGDALRRALHTWARATQEELHAPIPAADTLHALANQGTHILATLDPLLTASGPRGTAHAREGVRQAGGALTAVDQAWIPGLTTLTRPGQEFITASRGLFLVLEQARTTAARLDQQHRLRAADTLQQALTTLSYRLSAARSLPKTLAASRALYAPARRLEGAPDRLQDTIRGRYVPLGYTDIRDLDLAWRRAVDTVRHAHWVVQRPLRSVTDGATLTPIALR